MLGEAAPSDTGPPIARVAGDVVILRGDARQVEGGGVYGDVDLSEAGTIRLTLYDSLPGRPVDAPLPSGSRFGRVVYEARIGPLAPGAYAVVVGWFDPRAQLIELRHEPLQVEIRPGHRPVRRRKRTDVTLQLQGLSR